MEPDGLVPHGTFVEFSWHSFDTDGDLDGFPYPPESTGYFGASGDGTANSPDGEAGDGPDYTDE